DLRRAGATEAAVSGLSPLASFRLAPMRGSAALVADAAPGWAVPCGAGFIPADGASGSPSPSAPPRPAGVKPAPQQVSPQRFTPPAPPASGSAHPAAAPPPPS